MPIQRGSLGEASSCRDTYNQKWIFMFIVKECRSLITIVIVFFQTSGESMSKSTIDTTSRVHDRSHPVYICHSTQLQYDFLPVKCFLHCYTYTHYYLALQLIIVSCVNNRFSMAITFGISLQPCPFDRVINLI